MGHRFVVSVALPNYIIVGMRETNAGCCVNMIKGVFVGCDILVDELNDVRALLICCHTVIFEIYL